MAAIQNDRDILLQAASPRVVPVLIPIDQIEGLGPALKSMRIKTSGTTFIGSSGATNPATITLTAEKLGGLEGVVIWSVVTGSAGLSAVGDTCVVTGSTVGGYSVTIRARITEGATNYDAQVTLTKLGTLSAQESVNLTNQITGQLAMGNVTGYGALALLNQVNLNTQTTGALNGQTQVTNLGTLAYANAVYAEQIGAGQLAAGVVYAGIVNASQVNSGSFTGKQFTGGSFIGSSFSGITMTGGTLQTSQFNNDNRVVITGDSTGFIRVYGGTAGGTEVFKANSFGVTINGTQGPGTIALAVGGQGAAVRLQGGNGQPTAIFNPISTLPQAIEGGMAYHSTHKFIFSDGTNWYRPTWTQV